MIKLRRRTALAGIAALPLAALSNARAQAVDFPDRPLRLVVGFPPGGPNDLLARIVAPGIGERLKRSVVVENRAGANGEIAAASVAKAPPDGSVIMLASNGSTTVAPALNRNHGLRHPHRFRRRGADRHQSHAAGGAQRPAGQGMSPNFWRWPAPSRASSTARRPAPAAPRISPSSSSSRWARSTSCTCPTRAAGRPWPT